MQRHAPLIVTTGVALILSALATQALALDVAPYF